MQIKRIVLSGMATMVLILSIELNAQSPYELNKTQWMKEVSIQLPKEVCTDSSFFRSCYEITQQECLAKAESSLKTCLGATPIPNVVSSLTHGQKLGLKVGGCLGVALQKEFRKKKKEIPECESRHFSTN